MSVSRGKRVLLEKKQTSRHNSPIKYLFLSSSTQVTLGKYERYIKGHSENLKERQNVFDALSIQLRKYHHLLRQCLNDNLYSAKSKWRASS